MAVKDNRVHQLISESIVDVCRGELFQFKTNLTVNKTDIINYLRRINRKTALLIQTTEVGANIFSI